MMATRHSREPCGRCIFEQAEQSQAELGKQILAHLPGVGLGLVSGHGKENKVANIMQLLSWHRLETPYK